MISRDTEKLKSFLGTESEFQGDLMVRGILRMDGTITGKVKADQVILSETGVIKGDILAQKAFVAGTVEGIITAPDLVEIQAKGKVRGEVHTNKLIVIEGGEFNGQIRMKADDTKVLDFEPRSQEASLRCR